MAAATPGEYKGKRAVIREKDDDDKLVAVAWRCILAAAVLFVVGGFSAFAYKASVVPLPASEERPSASLVSLIADGKKHLKRDGKEVVCEIENPRPECRSDLLAR
ncbi:hypothetical protein [Paraburkholderia sp. J94]|uniref:hypothetical protein n=1 Tax=Paraburkholderia sp. J94 TaxID=2805441 RepID=UPI002AAF3504|nr:hypothetical protein [Paraburkholderia sp. J94]